MNLNCIAIDDEPPALDLICRFANQTPFLNLMASFSNAIEGLRYISEHKVDLILLDIQMPDLSGIELARILSGRNMNNPPAVIFTTAFEQFALEGYKLDIVDYLLKPFGYEEFLRGTTKALNLTRLKTVPFETTVKEEDYIYLKVEYQTIKIALNSIIYIEGLKDYAKIYLTEQEKPVLSLITLKALEEKLPKGRFMRIHKSFIVSLDKVTAVTKNMLYLGQTQFSVSDAFREEFTKFMSTWQ